MRLRVSDFISFETIASPAAANKVALGLCLSAITFLLCGSFVKITRVRLQVASLRAIDSAEPLMSGAGFKENGVYPLVGQPALKGDVRLYGSWLHSDASIGAVHSAWYQLFAQFYIFVCGYPNHADNQLIIEVETTKSGVVRFPISLFRNPGERWSLHKISLPLKEPARFRIVAVDRSAERQGWLGFSEPFLIRSADTLRTLKQLLLVILTTTASIVFFLSPGLMLRQKLFACYARHLPFIWVPVPGLLLLALLGLISWVGPHQLGPASISRVGLWALVLYVTYWFLRVPLSSFTSDTERRVLLILLVLAAIGVAKASYSVGPVGELYEYEISRSLEVGERSDSRMSYDIVQLVAFRSGRYSKFASSIFGGWNFSQRGPIAGLGVSPIVLSSPVQVSAGPPNQPWNVFDPEGFSAYRIAMIVLASCCLLAVFGLASSFLSEEWALLAFLVAVTAPFTIHDIYFTWPKFESASFVLLAAYLIFHWRYLPAGLAVGMGYLCHPSALVWVPSLVGFIVVWPPPNTKPMSLSRALFLWTIRTASMSVGLSGFLLFWWLINRKHFAQGFFLRYFAMSGALPLTPTNWLRFRFHSLLNTLVPLNLFTFHRNSPGLHSIHGPPSPMIAFFFQYWNTIPFGAGIGFFFCLLLLFCVALRKRPLWVLLVFVLPFAFFTLYWGWPSTGLLREGLHAWFLALLIASVVIWERYASCSQRFWHLCSWALLLRGLEILLMLLLPSVWSQHMLVQRQFLLTDIGALVIMLCGTAWLCIYTFRAAEDLRSAEQRRAHAIQ